MKKVILTEKQVETLRTKVNESAVGNERYSRQVSIYIETYGVKINNENLSFIVLQLPNA